jgi:hypothetical protein
MPAQQFFIFSQLTLLQNCPAVMAARQPLCALQHAGSGSIQMRARSRPENRIKPS